MTTGNISRPTGTCESGQYGTVCSTSGYYKTWNGGDRSPPTIVWEEVPRVKYTRRRSYDRPGHYELVPDFYTVRKKRYIRSEDSEDSPHPYSCVISRVNDPIVTIHRYPGDRDSWPATCLWYSGGQVSRVRWDPEDEYALLGRLRNAVAGSDFNLGVFLAEASETCGMIASTAVRIGSAINQVRRGNVVGAAITLTGKRPRSSATFGTVAARNWLELQYGWLPLLGDVKSGAEYLAHNFGGPFRKRVTASAKKVGTENTSPSPSYEYTSFEDTVSKRIVGYLTEVDKVKLVGLTDPASVAWELVPFSFVADWFIPVGNFLESRALAQALKGTFVVSELRKLRSTGFRVKPTSWYPEMDDLSPISGATFEDIRLSRSVTSSLAVPSPNFVGLSEASSWRRAANAVALVRVLFSKS